jgi:hypothetical protein
MKNKWLAAVLNIVPGLGYLYAGVRAPFAVLLLTVWPLFILSGFMMPIEDYEAMEEIPYRVWDFLPMICIVAAFVVDAFSEAVRANEAQKQSK